MAQVAEVRLVDDLDGGAADESVRFGLDSKTYEIDLSSENAQALRETLAPFVEAGRRVTRSKAPSSPGSGSGHPRVEAVAIREWAARAGFSVADRGRIPSLIVRAYRERQASRSGSTRAETGHLATSAQRGHGERAKSQQPTNRY